MTSSAAALKLVEEDERAREAALDPRRSLIVEAPAGAGKTELLIQRYLRLLAEVEEPEQILALTFTRKAAAEMRQRVSEALTSAHQPAPSGEPERRRWELAKAALRRDQERQWQLAENPARLRAQTIDAFCRALVERMPWLSRLGSLPEEAEAGSAEYRRAARSLLQSLEHAEGRQGAALRTVLDHLDNNFPRIETLIADMLAKRDQWLRHIAGARAAGNNLKERLEGGLQAAIRAGLRQVRAHFRDPAQAREVIALARFAAEQRPVDADAAAFPCADLRDLPGEEPEMLPHWRQIANMLLTDKGTRRVSFNKNQGFPANPAGKAMKQRCQELAMSEPLIADLHAVRALPPPHYEDHPWEALAALLEVLLRAVAELKVEFAREGEVDFTEIAMAARQALGDDDEPTDLAYALDGRLSHLLVDEFQDTSQGQYDLLVKLTREWQADDGRTVFLVGDPKQSIYRFREAEVGLFLRVQREGLGRLPLDTLQLRRNFRSRRELIDWVNDTGQAIFPRQANEATRAVPFAEATPGRADAAEDPQGSGHPHPGAVGVHLACGRDDWGEADLVVRLVRRAQQRNPRGTIAVLVRAKDHAAAITLRLREAKVAVRAVEMEALTERAAVQDLWALTRALLHPGDRMAWLAILRAPWCGLSLADLTVLAETPDAALWEALQNDERIGQLSAAGRAATLRLRATLGAALSERARRPLRRWIEGVWIALGGPACLSNETEYQDASAYLDLLDALDASGSGQDLDELEAQLPALFAAPDTADLHAVQILTIHKAKGLEFDTVILPGLGRMPGRSDPPLLRWDEILEAGEARLLLAPIREAAAKEREPIYDFLGATERQRAKNEALRLLYVALTRAKSELHLLGHVAVNSRREVAPTRQSLLAALAPAPAIAHELEQVQPPDLATAAPEAAAEPAARQFRRLAAGWTLPAPPPAVETPAMAATPVEAISYDWAGELRRQIGNVVHALLRRMAGAGGVEAQPETIRAALRQEGVAPADLRAAAARVEQALAQARADERGRWILAAHEAEANEYALSGWADGAVRHCRLDRTFIVDGVRWIIDYKTGVHEGGDVNAFLASERARYAAQLQLYAQLFHALEERPMRLGLFFPLVERAPGTLGWEEWSSYPVAAQGAR